MSSDLDLKVESGSIAPPQQSPPKSTSINEYQRLVWETKHDKTSLESLLRSGVLSFKSLEENASNLKALNSAAEQLIPRTGPASQKTRFQDPAPDSIFSVSALFRFCFFFVFAFVCLFVCLFFVLACFLYICDSGKQFNFVFQKCRADPYNQFHLRSFECFVHIGHRSQSQPNYKQASTEKITSDISCVNCLNSRFAYEGGGGIGTCWIG